MFPAPALVWFRHDLRLADNPALQAAIQSGATIIPVFIWSPNEEAPWQPGAASRWWLHQSLAALDRQLRDCGSRLILRHGPTLEALRQLAEKCGARAVYWNRRYEPAVIARDKLLKATLRDEGFAVETFNGSLLFEPWEIANGAGKPFQVFTPFWNACRRSAPPSAPIAVPTCLSAPAQWPFSERLNSFGLEPAIDWASGLRDAWTPGAAAAEEELHRFLEDALIAYRSGRELPAEKGTSRLSPHLHFGEVSPRQVWNAVQVHSASTPASGVIAAGDAYLRQLGWREFAYHLLFHFPHTVQAPLRRQFETFPWVDDATAFQAWRRGATGYPIVDAGMRELWASGWMHNRVRMIAGSFLVKDLLIPWQKGARWFWDTLVDADLANNTLGWQWIAGCGADAAPFFRIFNPVTQGEKFDADGAYVRRWLPELAGLPKGSVHKPWTVHPGSGGASYPTAIIDHDQARRRALLAYAQVKREA